MGGLWQIQGIQYPASTGMTGTVTFNTASTGQLVNGDTVWLYCTNMNNAMNNHEFTVTNVTATSMDLVGFTGALCNAGASTFDNVRFYLMNSVFSSTFPTGSPTGTVRRTSDGLDISSTTYPYHTGSGNYTDHAIAGYMPSGQTWNPAVNRLRWQITCNYNMAFNPDLVSGVVGPGGFNFGTFIKSNTANNNWAYEGFHFYHQFSGNQYASQTMYFEAMPTPTHSNQRGTVLEAPSDWTYLYGFLDQTAAHYFDSIMDYYIDYGPGINGMGNTTSAGSGSIGTANQLAVGGQCTLTKGTVAVVTGEVDSWIFNTQGTYNGTNYEIGFSSRSHMPTNATTFDVRYSTTGSLHTNGFSSGTSGGTATGGGALDDDPDVYYGSPAMAQAANIWFGIRPHMQVYSQTGSSVSPIIISPFGGHDLQTGDTVSVSGVTNVSNGTYTITRINPIGWTASRSGWTQTVVAVGSGTCTPQCATATVPSTTGLYPGMGLFVYYTAVACCGIGPLDTDANVYRAAIQSVLTSTTFTYNTVAAVGTYATNSCASAPYECPVMYTFPAMALQGTTGTGTAGTTTGTATPTSDTTGFYEIQIPAQGSPPQLPPSCDLNGDGVVNILDAQLMINATLGTIPCTSAYKLDGTTACDNVDVQRVIAAALGGPCVIGP
jgi:hypothetical protein